MDRALHRHFVKTAAEFSATLSADIKSAGSVAIPNRKSRGLGEFLSRVIVGQQLSTKAAATIWDRVKAAGKENGGRLNDLFRPDNFDTLRECGVSGNKVKALCAIRESLDDGILNTRKLARLSTEERCIALKQVHGIGQWTADMSSIFFFQDPDVWPDGDLSVVKVFNQYLSTRQKKNVARYSALFQPHRSFLAYYMWQLADGMPTR